MLHRLPLYLLIALCETLDSSNGIVDKIIDQILICYLLLIDHLTCESDNYLAVINKAGLHYFRQLRNQRLFFEKEVMGTFFCIDKDTAHGFKKVIENLLKVGCCVQGC